jgi:malonyl-CoA/methylmalonyl-CoA synthetase
MNANLTRCSRTTSANTPVTVPDDSGRTGRALRRLAAESARIALRCAAQGANRAIRVTVQTDKHWQVLALTACLRAGLVYLPLNTGYRSTELSYFSTTPSRA